MAGVAFVTSFADGADLNNFNDVSVGTEGIPVLPSHRRPPNLALQRTPATGRANGVLDARWSVSGSAELCR